MTGVTVHESRSTLLKALVAGDTVPDTTQESNAIRALDQAERAFSQAGAIEPPYNPVGLNFLFEHCLSIRTCVDGYVTNIDGFGHRFDPQLDLDDEDADSRISEIIRRERESLGTHLEQVHLNETPSADDVALRKKELAHQMRLEKMKLEQFFNFCVEDSSFVSLRKRLRQDLEVTGNAYFEVLRNAAGEIAEFNFLPSWTIRMLPLDPDYTEVDIKVRVGDIDYETRKRRKLFRRYVQIVDLRTVYFKEFGDPRVLSSRTGVYYQDSKAFRADAGPRELPATEIVHLKVHASTTNYGVPRWVSAMLSALGSRQAEEVNLAYFENKSIPPLAMLVSGAHFTPGTIERIENFIENNIKGKKNFHKILILEAESNAGPLDSNSDRPQISLQPLTDAMQKDAMFMAYDEANIDKMGMVFRLPRLLRGDVRDFNRATSESALEFAEQQVFGPERDDFDFMINRKILTEMGIRFWVFKSNAPKIQDPVARTGVITQLTSANIVTPGEARELATEVLGKELAKNTSQWTKQPIQLTLAGIPVEDPKPIDYSGDEGIGQPFKAVTSLQLTPTAVGSVVTVNEARAAQGLGPMSLYDGTPHPDGHLTIGEYQQKMQQQALGRFATGFAAPNAQSPGPFGGPPIPPLTGAKAPPQNIEGQARQIIAMRDALAGLEALEAAKAFYVAKRAEMVGANALRKEDEDKGEDDDG